MQLSFDFRLASIFAPVDRQAHMLTPRRKRVFYSIHLRRYIPLPEDGCHVCGGVTAESQQEVLLEGIRETKK
jgi:hypothetical protein